MRDSRAPGSVQSPMRPRPREGSLEAWLSRHRMRLPSHRPAPAASRRPRPRTGSPSTAPTSSCSHRRPRWPGELAAQLTHPARAAALGRRRARLADRGTTVSAVAIVGVIVLNAAFAFVQERQAERAVEALRATCRRTATVLRDGRRQVVDGADAGAGRRARVAEGDRISADARLLEGGVEVDMSALTGESHAGRSAPPSPMPTSARRSRRATWSSAARAAPAARRRRVVSPPGCAPSSAGSPRCRSGVEPRRARWSARSGGWPG